MHVFLRSWYTVGCFGFNRKLLNLIAHLLFCPQASQVGIEGAC